MELQVFPAIFKIGRSKEKQIVELLKFSLKMGVGGRGWWKNSSFAFFVYFA